MLKAFSERVAEKAGFDVTWIMMIAEVITEIISGCQNNASRLAKAIDDPSWGQELSLRVRCRREAGPREGRRIADAILSEAKPFKAAALAGMAAGGEFAFEDAVLAEVSGL